MRLLNPANVCLRNRGCMSTSRIVLFFVFFKIGDVVRLRLDVNDSRQVAFLMPSKICKKAPLFETGPTIRQNSRTGRREIQAHKDQNRMEGSSSSLACPSIVKRRGARLRYGRRLLGLPIWQHRPTTNHSSRCECKYLQPEARGGLPTVVTSASCSKLGV